MNRAVFLTLLAVLSLSAGLALAADAPSPACDVKREAAYLIPGQEFFYGRVNHMPHDGLLGNWEIAGRVVRVTEATVLDAKKRKFKVGNRVDVTGKIEGSEFLAECVKKR